MEIVIDERFCGPPASGNGGYVCGLVAALVGPQAEVTLRAPPPLGKPLAVERSGDRVLLRDGAKLLAEGAPAQVQIDVPAPVSLAEAEAASARYPWREQHFFPRCFVCGPRHESGLHVFTGPVEGRPIFAATWTPDASLAAEGTVRGEFVWAALDCPGGLAVLADCPLGTVGLLGRLAVRQHAPVRAGSPHVITAWKIAGEGRKLSAGAALFDAAGALCAASLATWILLK